MKSLGQNIISLLFYFLGIIGIVLGIIYGTILYFIQATVLIFAASILMYMNEGKK